MNQQLDSEYVLGVDASVIIGHGVEQGFSRNTLCLDELLARARLRPRREAEHDPEWKHFATYAVICADRSVLSYLRTPAGSESRLHGLRSIGIGGHVNTDDAETDSLWSAAALERAALRELHEEIFLPADCRLDFMGLVNDDSNDVGRVHIGLVYRCPLKSDDMSTARETALTDCRMLSCGELTETRDLYETWSQFLIERALDYIFEPA